MSSSHSPSWSLSRSTTPQPSPSPKALRVLKSNTTLSPSPHTLPVPPSPSPSTPTTWITQSPPTPVTSASPVPTSVSCSSSPSLYSVASSLYSVPSPTPPPIMPSGPREAALADALSRARDVTDAVGALDEYAWRSLHAGVRVREYCAAADRAVKLCPPWGIRLALINTPACPLFPFDLPAGVPYSRKCPYGVSRSTLPQLSRKQLLDALVWLARDRDDAAVKAQVLELALEYIGRRWREEDRMFESVAKKLAEVEAELVTYARTVRAVVPALYDLRFQLGLVERDALIWALGHSADDSRMLLSSWVVRRLSTGAKPSAVATDLAHIRQHLALPSQRERVTAVLASFFLDDRELPQRRTRTLSRLSARGPASKRKTLAIPWLSRKLDDERRPSLPTHLAEPGWSRLTRLGASTIDLSVSIAPTPAPTQSPPRYRTLGMSLTAASTNALGMSVMSTNNLLSDWGPGTADVRAALADHLLMLRYRLGPDADGWYLGGGFDKAADFLDSLDGKPETHEVALELRRAFGIPPAGSLLGHAHVHMQVMQVQAHAQAQFHGPHQHERDVSFDLDQYIADIGPQGDEDELDFAALRRPRLGFRTSVNSVVSTGSSASSHRTGEFTICEATRVPFTIEEVAYRFPEYSSGSSSFTSPSGSANVTPTPKPMPLPSEPSAFLPGRRVSRSLPTLVESPHTPIPALPSSKTPTTEFPGTAITPPHSPMWAAPSSPSPDPTSRKAITDECRPSRRQQFRQFVIVDGATVSPDPPPKELPDTEEHGVLHRIIPLFFGSVTEGQVEEALISMIEIEVKRVTARAGEFDAQAKARLLPEHLSIAARRVLRRLTNPHPPLHRTPTSKPLPPTKPSTPRRSDLRIMVPPRSRRRSLSVDSPDVPVSAFSYDTESCNPEETPMGSPLASPPTPRPTPPSARVPRAASSSFSASASASASSLASAAVSATATAPVRWAPKDNMDRDRLTPPAHAIRRATPPPRQSAHTSYTPSPPTVFGSPPMPRKMSHPPRHARRKPVPPLPPMPMRSNPF